MNATTVVLFFTMGRCKLGTYQTTSGIGSVSVRLEPRPDHFNAEASGGNGKSLLVEKIQFSEVDGRTRPNGGFTVSQRLVTEIERRRHDVGKIGRSVSHGLQGYIR